MRQSRFLALVAAVNLVVGSVSLHATPYASGVSVTGTSVSFILNEPTTSLTYSINGGPAQTLSGATIGTKTFNLGAPTDKFSIVADNTSTAGFTIPKVGTTLTGAAGHFPIDTQAANVTGGGAGQISNDANGLTKFNSVRGVDTSNNPNAANFGTAYITNSADQTGTPFTGRTSLLNKGLYAIKADGSDAFGYGDTAQQQVFAAANGNTPHRIFVANDGTPYMDGASDAISGVFRLSQNLDTVEQVFNGIDGPTDINIATNNHGSVYKTVVTGSSAAGNLKVYTLDEDLSSFEVAGNTGTGFNNNTNRLWRYDIGGATFPYAAPPVSVTPADVRGPLLDGAAVNGPGVFIAFIDMDLGADGKFYLSQNRNAPALTPGLFVVNPDGTTAWDSLTATHALPGQGASNDLFQNTDAVAVSPDQKWLAALHGDNFITIVPLVNGIPDLANRLAVGTGNASISSRDINFDAADNLWYASSGQALVRELTPGGHTLTTLAYDPSLAAGSKYSFSLQTVAASVAGDYNNDGKVDAQDYVLWRKSPATYGGDPGGYNAFRANFGTGGPGGSGSSLGGGSVPEPSSIALVALGLIAAGFRRRSA